MKCVNSWICFGPNAVLLKKKILPVVKIKKSGCIQDGVENALFFSPNIFKNDYLTKTFMENLFSSKFKMAE
jgi:hypothetical protein